VDGKASTDFQRNPALSFQFQKKQSHVAGGEVQPRKTGGLRGCPMSLAGSHVRIEKREKKSVAVYSDKNTSFFSAEGHDSFSAGDGGSGKEIKGEGEKGQKTQERMFAIKIL